MAGANGAPAEDGTGTGKGAYHGKGAYREGPVCAHTRRTHCPDCHHGVLCLQCRHVLTPCRCVAAAAEDADRERGSRIAAGREMIAARWAGRMPPAVAAGRVAASARRVHVLNGRRAWWSPCVVSEVRCVIVDEGE